MILTPDWKLPKGVRALYTNRIGGASKPPYSGFNLATHVGDELFSVQQNRKHLMQLAELKTSPFWLDQQHMDTVVKLPYENLSDQPVADASWSRSTGMVSVVMTADCLPILLCAQDGRSVAAVHAGWKGLEKGIITKTIQAMGVEANQLTAWVGPAISAQHFEVGQDVYDAFAAVDLSYTRFFQARESQTPKYLADLPGMAQFEMQSLGLKDVVLSGLCSYEDEQQFYSYRRDTQTGRMASMIWIES